MPAVRRHSLPPGYACPLLQPLQGGIRRREAKEEQGRRPGGEQDVNERQAERMGGLVCCEMVCSEVCVKYDS